MIALASFQPGQLSAEPKDFAGRALNERTKGRKLQKVTKELFGIHVLLTRSHFEPLLLSKSGVLICGGHAYCIRDVMFYSRGRKRESKFVSLCELFGTPSSNLFHAHAYRLFSPVESSSSADWEHGLELGELSVNSCICSIEEASNGLLVKHYATAGGSRYVVRIDIGYGEPLKWIEGSFQDPAEAGVWRRWQARIPKLLVGELICVRAWDSAANTQPEDPENVWNFKGYMNNACHSVRFGMPWQDVIVAKPELEFYL